MSRISINAKNDAGLFSLLQALVNRLLGRPNLRTGTTTTRVQVAAFDYQIADRVYAKAAEDNVQVTGLTNTPAATFRKVRVQIDADGTLSFSEGASAGSQAAAAVPRRTANRATVGWIEIPASFTYGTTAFSAAGVSFFDGDPDCGDGAGVPPNDRGIEQTVYTGP